ncbi:MAG: hypothetical protein K2K05_00540, partial [Muribaculaceae bacterium]|nr:hypothetical protein [Muribaculaceae bacterium]
SVIDCKPLYQTRFLMVFIICRLALLALETNCHGSGILQKIFFFILANNGDSPSPLRETVCLLGINIKSVGRYSTVYQN